MSTPRKSGIETTVDGASFIPASKRADGSTRKEIRVRPGYKPPEDIETYRNRSAEAWKSRGNAGVPGAEGLSKPKAEAEIKNKNAKRREAAKKRAATGANADSDITDKMRHTKLDEEEKEKGIHTGNDHTLPTGDEVDRQKKIRNHLKKLKAVRELKQKRVHGEKLSHDQIMKLGKEEELLRDLKKLNYDGPELQESFTDAGVSAVEVEES